MPGVFIVRETNQFRVITESDFDRLLELFAQSGAMVDHSLIHRGTWNTNEQGINSFLVDFHAGAITIRNPHISNDILGIIGIEHKIEQGSRFDMIGVLEFTCQNDPKCTWMIEFTSADTIWTHLSRRVTPSCE